MSQLSRTIQTSSSSQRMCQGDVCSVIQAIKEMGSEWRMIIAYYLLEKPLRFNELLKKGRVEDLNARTLSRTLRHLEGSEIVQREVVSTRPFSVRYNLTEKGKDFAEVLQGYRKWGDKWAMPLHSAHPDSALRTRLR